MERNPHGHYFYMADTKYCPLGTKTDELIRWRDEEALKLFDKISWLQAFHVEELDNTENLASAYG